MERRVGLVCSLLILFATTCSCDDWHDSYIDAYKESEGTYDGPYPHYPTRMPMQMPMMSMRPNMTSAAAMMPFLLQIVMLVARIILKMTIFKIIVKFIAVVCLFLFIPTLRLPRMKRSENRAWKNWDEEEKNVLDSLTIVVKDALAKYKNSFS